MHKKILRVVSAMLILVSIISVLPSTASSVADTEAERISALVTSTYKQALKATKRNSFHGWCATAVAWQMRMLGIITRAVATDGKDMYDYYSKMDYTTGGYKVDSYPAKKYNLESALNAITNNGTENAYNIMAGFQRTNTSAGRKYGHAVFIYAIVDGIVYFTESYGITIGGKYYAEGKCVTATIAQFAKSYNSWCKYEGIVCFGLKTYQEECLRLNAYLYAAPNTATTLYSAPCVPEVDDRSEPLRQLQAGERLSVIGMYRNTKGEYWYEVEDSQIGYVRADETDMVSMRYDDVAAESVKAPTVLKEGSSFNIKGSITGKYVSIISVRAQVFRVGEDGLTHVMTTNEPVSANDYSLYKSKVAKRLSFKLLDQGSYHYELAAVVSNHYYADGALQTEWQTVKLWKSDFQVVEKKGETATVKFDACGGVSQLDAAEMTLNEPVANLPAAQRDGYVFDGWYTADGEKVDEEYVLEGKLTLYAGWVEAGNVTGWYTEDGRSYYVQDGVRLEGFFRVDGVTYYQGSDGFLVTGWQILAGERYYFNANGVMATGWLLMPEGTYYIGIDGTPAVGWVTVGDETYYFLESGIMATGQQIIDDRKYIFGLHGELVKGKMDPANSVIRPGTTTIDR